MDLEDLIKSANHLPTDNDLKKSLEEVIRNLPNWSMQIKGYGRRGGHRNTAYSCYSFDFSEGEWRMGEIKYFIVSYATSRVIKDLTQEGVLVSARILMDMPNPSFDIFEVNSKTCVTNDFETDETGKWKYNPAPKLFGEDQELPPWKIDQKKK